MRHVHSISICQNTEFKPPVAQVLNPLYLIPSIIDETLVEEWEILPSLDHDIGFQVHFSETRQGSVRDEGRKIWPIGRKIVLDWK